MKRIAFEDLSCSGTDGLRRLAESLGAVVRFTKNEDAYRHRLIYAIMRSERELERAEHRDEE